jgi:hypothetical protein
VTTSDSLIAVMKDFDKEERDEAKKKEKSKKVISKATFQVHFF